MVQSLQIYQVDAFTSKVFKGNPAAVIPLQEWMPDALMQAIAAENNLPETAFFIATESDFAIRWFTPICEVALCGHATLAAAHVIFNEKKFSGDALIFDSASGPLTVRKHGNALSMDFPTIHAKACAIPKALSEALGMEPLACLRGDDYIAVLRNESLLRGLNINLAKVASLDARGLIVTAAGDDVDFVARFFAPNAGIDEDPVTGSAYCQLAPYWSTVLGKLNFRAQQLSQRGGELECALREERVLLTGNAVLYLRGAIQVPSYQTM